MQLGLSLIWRLRRHLTENLYDFIFAAFGAYSLFTEVTQRNSIIVRLTTCTHLFQEKYEN